MLRLEDINDNVTNNGDHNQAYTVYSSAVGKIASLYQNGLTD